MLRMFMMLALLCLVQFASAQQSEQIIILHDTVGTSIDSTEKAKYHLFTFWSAKQFDHAEFLLNADSTISIRGTMKDGAVYIIPCTKKEFDQYNYQVRYYAGLIPKEKCENCGENIGAAIGSLTGCITGFFMIRRKKQ